MPKVGMKEFPYTAKGKAAAKMEAKKTGKPMKKAAKKTSRKKWLSNMAGYLENLIKEAKDFKRASDKTSKYSDKGRSYPPNDMLQSGKGREYFQALASDARKYQDAQFGRMFGALLKGRSYDNKTGKSIKRK
jgi:hypothetical protein